MKRIRLGLLFGGAGMMVLGAILMLVPHMERLGTIIVALGSLLAVVGIAFEIIGRASKGTGIRLLACGSGTMVFGLAVAMISGFERLGLAIASIGFALAAGGFALAIPCFVRTELFASKRFGWFQILIVIAFALGLLWNLKIGVQSSFDCSRFSKSAGVTITHLVYASLGTNPAAMRTRPDSETNVTDSCLFAVLDFSVAVACALFLAAVLRQMKGENRRRSLQPPTD